MLTNKTIMSKDELYLLCCLKLKEKRLYELSKTINTIEELRLATERDFVKEDIKRAKDLSIIMEKKKIKVCAFFDNEYPSVLKNIPFFPPFLFYIGEYKKEDEKAISIVGSRRASLKGLELTERLVKDFAGSNVTIVSGLATGIDTKAHRTALEVGLRTIAVLGSGIDVIYPPDNKELYKVIAEQGVIFSEQLPQTPPFHYNFPKRNRIISGLSKGVVVVEANEKSGSLITARYAIEQNRELYVFPRTPLEKNSEGNNNLIKYGAKIITKGEDVLEDLFHERKRKEKKSTISLSKEEEKIISHLSLEPINFDTLCFLLDMAPSTLANFLLILEMKGLIKELPGKFYINNMNGEC